MAGLYIHIPFCKRKCHYCDFYSSMNHSIVPDFVSKLCQEIHYWQKHHNFLISEMPFSNENLNLFDTIYFGGGTPSVLHLKQLNMILKAFSSWENFSRANIQEFSFECNPENGNRHYFQGLRKLGVTKLCLGIQSLEDRHCKILGRLGSRKVNLKAIELALLSGFDIVSLDFIFGIPGQDIDELIRDLDLVLALGVNHISCYQLTLATDHPLYLQLPDDDYLSNMYSQLFAYFAHQQWKHYEISNYCAKEDGMSKHNRHYWQNGNYLGLGPSAHSRIGVYRFSQTKNINTYLQQNFVLGLSPEQIYTNFNEVNIAEQLQEYLIGAVRTRHGLSFDDYPFSLAKSTGGEAILEAIQSYLAQGWLCINNNRFSITDQGMLFSDTILTELAYTADSCFL